MLIYDHLMFLHDTLADCNVSNVILFCQFMKQKKSFSISKISIIMINCIIGLFWTTQICSYACLDGASLFRLILRHLQALAGKPKMVNDISFFSFSYQVGKNYHQHRENSFMQAEGKRRK